MADITNPQLVKFANEKARVMVDSIDSMYETCKRFQSEYVALNISNTPDTVDNFADGSETDGRKRFRGQQMLTLKTLVDALVTYLEANGRITQIKSISVNSAARF